MNNFNAENLFKEYHNNIYRVCLVMLKNVADSEDALQETFIRLLNNNPSFTNEFEAQSWLFKTARNICKNKLSYWFNKSISLEEVENILQSSPLEDKEIFKLIVSLNFPKREIIYLYYVEGYSTDEIATILDMKPNTVRSHMKRAKEKLKGLAMEMEVL